MTQVNDALAISLLSELITADQLARARLSKALPKGMELSHFSVLNHLANTAAERTPAQLARTFHVTKGAMSNTLNKLEAAGHVHVRPDWDDARRKLVSVSPAGRAARDSALQAITPMISEMASTIGADKVRAVLPILRELRIRLENDN
ncbi:MAG: MarR family transcriptional regulator [Dinoroseobacter sp.]|nr:MarR family transcriptional regulator [Dinoroseobacter sp.]MDJ0995159.1 MarR family transcriptional regulator [Dinoroseobacter sp.]